jgi:hypothetical protein
LPAAGYRTPAIIDPKPMDIGLSSILNIIPVTKKRKDMYNTQIDVIII